MSSDANSPNYPAWLRLPWIARAIDWLSARERYILALSVALQIVFLVAMMVRPLITLATGETILLRVVPLDPRDLFRGDYVTLTYEINRPGGRQSNWWGNDWNRIQQQGKPVYVLLQPDGDDKHWKSNGVQFDPPTSGKFIRGTTTGYGLIVFGIEQFFVQEGTGHDYEKAVRDKKLSAEIAVDKNGSAQIKRLIIE